MKNGLRVFDADTHVEPTAEVLDTYVDPSFRPRLAELAQYRQPVRPGAPGGAPGRHVYRYGQISYKRILGEAAPRETHSGRDTQWMGSKQPRVGTQDDQAASRLQDMDDEGTDTHFLIPTSWTSFVGHEDPAIEVNIIRAFHRHIADFSGNHPDRLQSMIVASSPNVDAACEAIREGDTALAVASCRSSPRTSRPTTPSSTRSGAPPTSTTCRSCIPAYLDAALFPATPICGTTSFRPPRVAPVGRDALHRLGDRRRHDGPLPQPAGRHLNAALAGCRSGTPHGRAVRLCRQHCPAQDEPSEYLTSGRYFCSVERHEGRHARRGPRLPRRRRPDVRLRLSAFGMPVPETVDNFLAWDMKPDVALS